MPIRSTTSQSCSRVCVATDEGRAAICGVRGLGIPPGSATRLGACSCHSTAPASVQRADRARGVGQAEGRGEAGEGVMGIVWFTDEDRQRMRAENAQQAEHIKRELLFLEFLRERGDSGIAVPMTPELIERIGRLDLRPWPDRPAHDQP